jgi:pimeloyl-ACP methyl ester carboxylesterase
MRFRRSQREQRERRRRLEIDEAHVALSLDMEGASSTLLLAFGGLNSRLGIPPFEFLSLTGDIPVKRMFVRDLHQAWYHRGLPGYGDSLLSVAESLSALIAGHGVRRLVVAGTSAGGYAALVCGALLGADVVLSFSPQTILDLDALASMGDRRWDENLRPLVAANALDPDWIDLGVALAMASPLEGAHGARTSFRVFFDDSLAIDRLHCERLLGLEGLRLYRFGTGGHHLVRTLRDNGALTQILQRAVRSPADGPVAPGALESPASREPDGGTSGSSGTSG